MSKLRQYRCTRNQPDPTVPLGDRQGYYLFAKSEREALSEMQKRFPNDTAGFTAILW